MLSSAVLYPTCFNTNISFVLTPTEIQTHEHRQFSLAYINIVENKATDGRTDGRRDGNTDINNVEIIAKHTCCAVQKCG